MNKLSILIIDDDDLNLELMKEYCKEFSVNIITFDNSLEALKYAIDNPCDIVLTDYLMPGLNGLELSSQLKSLYPDIFIIMITAVSSNFSLKLNALKNGVSEFLNKPMDRGEFSARLKNALELVGTKNLLMDKAQLLLKEVDIATKTIREREFETLLILGKAAEYKDNETAKHIERVANYSMLLLSKLTNDQKSLETIYYAAPLHDIGKIGIDENILLKPDKLTFEEYNIIKTHAEIGENILHSSKSRYLLAGAEIAISHHEKFDGSGYPKGLVGEEIPLFGRIVALADVFDALTTKRPYKAAWSLEKAYELIRSERGTHFDPKLVDIFFENIREIEEIYNRFKE